MSAALLAIIQAISYAIAKGCTEAYLDAIKERSTAVEETVNETDRANAARFNAAVTKLHATGRCSTELDNSSSDKS